MKPKKQHYILNVQSSTRRYLDVIIAVSIEFAEEYGTDYEGESLMRADIENTLESQFGCIVGSHALMHYWWPISKADAHEYYPVIFNF